jgi:hypothetical protein
VAYFSRYALWNYLTIPFLYTYPGFATEELAAWRENGEQWRTLKVILPDSIASHWREPVAYFGPDGLLRRHEYRVDIIGGAIASSMESSCQRNAEPMHPTPTNERLRSPC